MAASDKVLGNLHAAVANALAEQVAGVTETDAEGNERLVRASPALLGAAITFLKNNNITADVENNAELRELSEALAARRKKKIPQATLDEAAEAFSMSQGGFSLQ